MLEYLRGLPNLQTLDLTHTKVTDSGLASLKGLTKLQSLEVNRLRAVDNTPPIYFEGRELCSPPPSVTRYFSTSGLPGSSVQGVRPG